MKKFSLYGLFHSRRDDLPDIEEEDTSPNLKRFFKLLWRRFWKLITLNIMMWPMIVPIMIAVFLYLGISKTPSGFNAVFPQLYGAHVIEQTTESTFLLDLFGAQFMIPAYHNTPTYVGICICILFLFLTFGWQNIGATYILRGIVRGEPVFLVSDYFYAIRRNWKQGFFLGIIDFLVLFLIGFDVMYFWGLPDQYWNNVMLFGIMALGIIYFFMRFYIYHLQITFHLSIRKIFKNALIFTTLGVKRNLMGALGILLLSFIVVLGLILFAVLFNFNIAIPLILPLFYYLSFTAFIAAYAAYPIIDRYMIAPYQGGDEKTEDEEAEAPSSDAE